MRALFRSFILCILYFPLCSVAQDTAAHWNPGFNIEANTIAGKVLKYDIKFILPLPEVSTGTDINFVWRTDGQKEWQQRWHYPEVGIGFTYTHYGLTAIYGTGYAAYGNIGIVLLKDKRLEWRARLGEGLGYLTRRYSRQYPVDTTNVAIGSHLNGFFLLMTDVRYTINKHWDIQLGANFSHFSDASFNKPNLGINMYGGHIGVAYSPAGLHPQHIKSKFPLHPDWVFGLRGTMAIQSVYVADGPHYPVYLATAYAARRWMPWDKAFAGIDYSYHESIYAYLRNNGLYRGHEAAHAYKSAVFAGNEFLFGRIGIIFQLGYYLQQSAVPLGSVYEKLGGAFYLARHKTGPLKEVYLCTFVKAHLNVAELQEFGIGIGF